jgi:hypothetical protein
MDLIWGRHEAENFFGEDWTDRIALKWKEKFRFRRRGFFESLPAQLRQTGRHCLRQARSVCARERERRTLCVIACDKREAFAQGSECDEAIHFLPGKQVLDCFASLAMTGWGSIVIPRHNFTSFRGALKARTRKSMDIHEERVAVAWILPSYRAEASTCAGKGAAEPAWLYRPRSVQLFKLRLVVRDNGNADHNSWIIAGTAWAKSFNSFRNPSLSALV